MSTERSLRQDWMSGTYQTASKITYPKKKRKWTKGLTWSDGELAAIARGGGSEAYDWTYGIYPIPKSYRKAAAAELKQRHRKMSKVS